MPELDGSLRFGSPVAIWMAERDSSRVSSWIPIAAADCSMIGDMLDQGAKFRLPLMTPLHSGASHVPSWSVSYFDCAISAFAASTSPAKGGCWNGK